MKVKIIASIGNYYRVKEVDIDETNMMADLPREIHVFAEEFMKEEEAKKFAYIFDYPLKIKVL